VLVGLIRGTAVRNDFAAAERSIRLLQWIAPLQQ